MIIGPTFASELKAAGLDPQYLAFEGDASSDIKLVTTLNPLQQVIFDNVVAAHDPTKQLVTEEITDRQFFQALAQTGQITQDEALAAVAVGAIPAQMETAIANLPATQQFPVRMMVSGSIAYHRNSPTVASLQHLLGWTDAQTDDLWKLAVTL
jgi:hypothetical protein